MYLGGADLMPEAAAVSAVRPAPAKPSWVQAACIAEREARRSPPRKGHAHDAAIADMKTSWEAAEERRRTSVSKARSARPLSSRTSWELEAELLHAMHMAAPAPQQSAAARPPPTTTQPERLPLSGTASHMEAMLALSTLQRADLECEHKWRRRAEAEADATRAEVEGVRSGGFSVALNPPRPSCSILNPSSEADRLRAEVVTMRERAEAAEARAQAAEARTQAAEARLDTTSHPDQADAKGLTYFCAAG